MTWIHALVLGIIEGLTEFLPVSSTGHLILFSSGTGQEDEAAKTLDVVIQLGAVIAVLVYYRPRLASLVDGLRERNEESLRLVKALTLAFLPAAAFGFLFHKKIEHLLFSPGPVAAALIAGGVLMIAVELGRHRMQQRGAEGLAEVTERRALFVGIAQVFSLWPGASRSMTTIVGGQLSGLSTATAADFSFLLSIPTLGAATVFKLVKSGPSLLSQKGFALSLAVGMLVSFAVALLVISVFIRYLKRFGLLPFGIYRILLGVVVLVVLQNRAAKAPEKSLNVPLESEKVSSVASRLER